MVLGGGMAGGGWGRQRRERRELRKHREGRSGDNLAADTKIGFGELQELSLTLQVLLVLQHFHVQLWSGHYHELRSSGDGPIEVSIGEFSDVTPG